MDPAAIFLGFFSVLLFVSLAINFINGQTQRKDRLLTALSGCDHIDMELLANSKMLVAISKATNKLFDEIEDEVEKAELYEALEIYSHSLTTDSTRHTLLGLTKRLSNEGLLGECNILSSNLKSLCREALRSVNAMNNDVSSAKVDLTLFKKMLAFGLTNVRLTDVHVHA